MAWTQQAQRFALAGLHDPSQPFSEQQSRLAFAGVPAASDLTIPYSWTQADRYALYYLPDPDSGFTYLTRSAIGYSPSAGQSDNPDRDGVILATLGGLSVDFDGTFTLPTFDGSIATTLSGVSVSLQGSFGYRHYFEIEYSVTPTWVVREQPARFGDVAVTLEGLSAVYRGLALPPDSTSGQVAMSLSGLSADLDGTFTVAPARSGDIDITFSSLNTLLQGAAVPPTGYVGNVDVNLAGLTLNFDGTAVPWNTGGSMTVTLEPLTVDMDGQFIDAGANAGAFALNLGGLSVQMQGTAINTKVFDRIDRRMTDISGRREMQDTSQRREMR